MNKSNKNTISFADAKPGHVYIFRPDFIGGKYPGIFISVDYANDRFSFYNLTTKDLEKVMIVYWNIEEI